MEETVANVRLEVDELHHHDVSPNQIVCKEAKNVAVTAVELAENPEYIVMRRSTAVQTVTNEEVAIPKRDLVLNQRSNLTEVSSEGGSTMEIDISSQESLMDIASQESLSAKDPNSGELHCLDHKVSASSHKELILKEEAARKTEESRLPGVSASSHKELTLKEEVPRKMEESRLPGVSALLCESLLMEDEALRKLEDAMLECGKGLRMLKEAAVNRKKAVLQLKMDAREHQETLHNQEAQLADQEKLLKKFQTEIKIHELEALGYKVVPPSIESNGCLPPKRARRD